MTFENPQLRFIIFWVTTLFVSSLYAIPSKIMTYAEPASPYRAIYVAHDYETQKLLNSFYSFDEQTNLVSIIISNTFIKAKDPKDSSAPLRLCYCYLSEIGQVKKDCGEALKWLKIAEERGNVSAAYSLGQLYASAPDNDWLNEWPVKRNDSLAFAYYKKAAESGLPVAMTKLGICYAKGIGTEPDEFCAFDWFRKASENGEYLGQCNYVISLLIGFGVRRDIGKAKFEMLRLADAKYHYLSLVSYDTTKTMQSWLGDFFSDGVYEARNTDNAVYWYSQSGSEYSGCRMCELLGLYPDYYAIDLRNCSTSRRLRIKKVDCPKNGVWPDKYKTDFLLLKRIDGGPFVFGSNGNEPGRYPNENRSQRRIVKGPYYLGVYEVTRAQWNHVMRSVSNIGEDNPKCPVTNIPFSQIYGLQQINEAHKVYFLNELSEKTDMSFRLPSEEEWEFACRAGTTDQNLYVGGNDEVCLMNEGRYLGNGGVVSEVGQYSPNTFGLYDMIGNVWERVDWIKSETPAFPWFRSVAAITNFIEGPLAYEAKGQLSVVRGGSWRSPANDCRIGVRFFINRDKGYDSVGLRVSMKLPTNSERIFDLVETLEKESK